MRLGLGLGIGLFPLITLSKAGGSRIMYGIITFNDYIAIVLLYIKGGRIRDSNSGQCRHKTGF